MLINSRLKDLFPRPRIHNDNSITRGLVQVRPSFFCRRSDVDGIEARVLTDEMRRGPIPGPIGVNECPNDRLEESVFKVNRHLVHTFLDEEVTFALAVPDDRFPFGEASA